MTTTEKPSAAAPDPTEPSRPDGALTMLIDRLPETVGPAWFLAALVIAALTLVALAMAVSGSPIVVGFGGATLGGGLGLAGLIRLLRKRA
ncbi:hypothetical protein [Amycolatopsis orientalis]|uniref:hypothetical protein n=1 Tax=Amycolatopsis orientalis TaxID=31958 RepID=UPI0003A76158|nr:hypothetical protein [Amycolatopsis orientalis]